MYKDKVVYTYGAFDLIHSGHVKLLERAKELGDFLIVGVVADDAIKELKGDDRPIQSVIDRMYMVGVLPFVNRVVMQRTYDPSDNIENSDKDITILVKGDDWDYIPGEETIKERGGKLVKLPYTQGPSTSAIIKKIRGEK